MAAEARRDPARWPADTATDVKDALAGARVEERHHLVGRLKPRPWKWSSGARASGVIGPASPPRADLSAARIRAAMSSLE